MKWYVAFRATVDGCVVSETMPAVPTVTVNVSSPRKRGSPSRTSASASVSVTYVFPLPETAFPFSTALTCVTHSPTSPAVPPITVTEPAPSFFRDCPVHCGIQDGDAARAAARNIALNRSLVGPDGTAGGILHITADLEAGAGSLMDDIAENVGNTDQREIHSVPPPLPGVRMDSVTNTRIVSVNDLLLSTGSKGNPLTYVSLQPNVRLVQVF